MSNAWFASKIAPNGDTNDNEGGCDSQEAQALKAYLRHKTTPSEAAQAITRPVSNAPVPKDELHHLWGLIQDAFLELPHKNIAPLITLMRAIEDLPNPAAVPNDSGHPDDGFWRESPGFGNLWADMSPAYAWRGIVDGSVGDCRDELRLDNVRHAEVEARLVHAGLAGLTVHWGYEVVADALESSDAVYDFEVPAAVEWIVVCGKKFKQGAGKREQSWGLKAGSRKPLRDLWKADDDSVMTMERWEFWKERLSGFQVDPELVRDVRRAFESMEEVDPEMMETRKINIVLNLPIEDVDVGGDVQESDGQDLGGQAPNDQDYWKWLKISDPASYLGAHQILIPVGLYTKEKLVWLNDNLTNSIDIDSLALLDTVCQVEKLKEEPPLMISTVWYSNTERDETTKRSLRLIDMEPEQKKWLLNDLATFFDKNSLAYFRSNGNPYRRGYLLYGPPGTGKTSLAQAIASDYDLELFEIKLAKMTDARLQSTFKTLPSRCVVLIEDIDEKTEKKATQPEGWGESAEVTFDDDPEAYCRKHDIEIEPEHSFVTLSGLLNTLDEPGAKEGRFAILTTNSPKSLDKALTRKGRTDKIIYMGYSCPGSAACTFKRMFGTDLTFPVPEAELERLAERFAKKIPKDMFTPCDIVDYCRSYRGRPREVIKNFRKFVEDRIEGKGEYLYDIKDDDQEGKSQDDDTEDKAEKASRLIAALPPDEPYPDSDGEDNAYFSMDGARKSPSPDAESDSSSLRKVAGSPEQSRFPPENSFAMRPRLADKLRAHGEQDWMFEDGHYPPEWAYKDWIGL
ncbi:hypothetical protein E8E12_001596 [Didymella heteroderae]|uniref:AAA+ ATPase domain-containing protein n=1 Tax=Didymella heteroderae TaxID=1769908 RepID=A0A9P4WIY6_9PLEO|nr:hypothetical protein E8E12_001596 [Didymella heteroderae]